MTNPNDPTNPILTKDPWGALYMARPGLTKLEEFAKAAMQGLCANPVVFGAPIGKGRRPRPDCRPQRPGRRHRTTRRMRRRRKPTVDDYKRALTMFPPAERRTLALMLAKRIIADIPATLTASEK